MHTATFTLTMDNDGMVTPSLTFNPLVDPALDDAPPIYGFMAECALAFLRQADLIDQENQWISEEAADGVQLTLAYPEEGVVKH